MAAAVRAVIDIGTNSVLLLVGYRRPDGGVHVVCDEARITRLGEGVAETGCQQPEAVARTLAVLADYKTLAAKAGAPIVAVATEGTRMAKNAAAFLTAAAEVLGVDVRLLSGEEEAQLSYRSVVDATVGDASRVVVDIGGGSTELVVGRGRLVEAYASHAIGSVRLTERCLHHDPPRPDETAELEAQALAALSNQPIEPHAELYGVAGTVTTVAALLLELSAYERDRVDGSRFSCDAVVALRDRLAAIPLSQRVGPCLPERRADVIVAGVTILVVVMRHVGATTLVACDRGLRFGLM